MQKTTTTEACLDDGETCKFPRCKPKCLVILPANGPIAIKFLCRSASGNARSYPMGREAGEYRFISTPKIFDCE